MANFKKGSAAAKAFMAKLRAARGKTKIVKAKAKTKKFVKAKAKTKVGMDATENNIKVTSNVKNRTFTIKKNGITYRTGKFSKPEFEELEYNTQNDWANFLRTQDNYSKVKTGAVKKVMPAKKASSMHKDTKSHNVNISVVSGTNDFNIERLKKATARLTELQRVYTNAKAVPLKDRNNFSKLMIRNIPKLIKNEKEFISIIKKNIK